MIEFNTEPLYARFEDVEARVREAAEQILLDYEQTEGPPLLWEIEHGQEQAKRIASTTMMHLDGYTQREIEDGIE